MKINIKLHARWFVFGVQRGSAAAATLKTRKKVCTCHPHHPFDADDYDRRACGRAHQQIKYFNNKEAEKERESLQIIHYFQLTQNSNVDIYNLSAFSSLLTHLPAAIQPIHPPIHPPIRPARRYCSRSSANRISVSSSFGLANLNEWMKWELIMRGVNLKNLFCFFHSFIRYSDSATAQ